MKFEICIQLEQEGLTPPSTLSLDLLLRSTDFAIFVKCSQLAQFVRNCKGLSHNIEPHIHLEE